MHPANMQADATPIQANPLDTSTTISFNVVPDSAEQWALMSSSGAEVQDDNRADSGQQVFHNYSTSTVIHVD